MLLQIPFLASKRHETVEKDLSVGETGTEKKTKPVEHPLKLIRYPPPQIIFQQL